MPDEDANDSQHAESLVYQQDEAVHEENSRNIEPAETTKQQAKTMQEAERRDRRLIGAPSTDTDAVHHNEAMPEKYWSVSDVVSHQKAPSSTTDQLQAVLGIQEHDAFRPSDLNPYSDFNRGARHSEVVQSSHQ